MRTERYSELFVNRRDAYCEQRQDGSYLCRRHAVTDEVVAAHLRGDITCGWYAINRLGRIKWGCVDADKPDGISTLQRINRRLTDLGLPSYIEESRQGRGHLWLFVEAVAPRPVRTVLREVSGEDMEIFPKQDRISGRGLGSAVRGPLGVHRRTGVRYGFVEPRTLAKVGKTLREELDYLANVQVARGSQVAEALADVLSMRGKETPRHKDTGIDVVSIARMFTELEWKGHYYVGLCPLHAESHHSFAVYPNQGGVAWGGGNASTRVEAGMPYRYTRR